MGRASAIMENTLECSRCGCEIDTDAGPESDLTYVCGNCSAETDLSDIYDDGEPLDDDQDDERRWEW